MATSLKSLQSKAIAAPAKVRAAKGSDFDWSKFTGKMGTVTLKGKTTESGNRVNLFGSSAGKGSPYVGLYLPTVDDRHAIVAAGLTITADMGTITEQSNGKFKVVATLPALATGQRPEPITIGGFPTADDAAKFVSVTIKAS